MSVGILLAAVLVAVSAGQFPSPFSRELQVIATMMSGSDVVIAQNLIARTNGVTISQTGYYDPQTAAAVSFFQKQNNITVSGNVDPTTASAILNNLSYDGYKDDGQPASARGYLYKVYIPVYQNRTNGKELLSFRVRAHGCDVDGCQPWPDFNNQNDGLNMFSSDGNTPTGLMEFDLNSPEPDPQTYGPYPINRAVQGLEGNAAFLLPNIRNGILMHTGQWPGWAPPEPMPNSEGCVHSWPENIYNVWQILIGLGVQVRNNPFGQTPYPYVPQGLLSIEQID